MNIFKKKTISFISSIVVCCFILLCAFQVSFDIEEAAQLNVRLIRDTATILKTQVLYPYLAVFIRVEDTQQASASAEEKRVPVSGAEKSSPWAPNLLYAFLGAITFAVFRFLFLFLGRFEKLIIIGAGKLKAHYLKWRSICSIAIGYILQMIVLHSDMLRVFCDNKIFTVEPHLASAVKFYRGYYVY